MIYRDIIRFSRFCFFVNASFPKTSILHLNIFTETPESSAGCSCIARKKSPGVAIDADALSRDAMSAKKKERRHLCGYPARDDM
jgi:hypothetical protein